LSEVSYKNTTERDRNSFLQDKLSLSETERKTLNVQ